MTRRQLTIRQQWMTIRRRRELGSGNPHPTQKQRRAEGGPPGNAGRLRSSLREQRLGTDAADGCVE